MPRTTVEGFLRNIFLFIRYDGSKEVTMTLVPFLPTQNAVPEAGLVTTTRRPWWNCGLFTMNIQWGSGGMNDTHLLSLVYSKWWLMRDQQFSVTLWQSSLKPGSSVLEPLGRPLTELVVEWGFQEIRSGHISLENHDPKGYMHCSVHCRTVYNSQDMEIT